MKVDVYFSVAASQGVDLGDRWIAVIDVLRAGTSLAYALHNGAKAVLATDSSEEALRIVGNLPREDVVLCGERGGMPIPGFQVGNSPGEFTPDLVKDKTVVMTTSNGTQGIVRSGLGERLVVPALVNLDLAADFLATRAGDNGLVVLCCGSEGKMALEDVLCAGMLVRRLEGILRRKARGNDGLTVALTIAGRFGSRVERTILNSEHGRELIALGMEEDVRVCAKISIVDLLPVGKDGRLVGAKES